MTHLPGASAEPRRTRGGAGGAAPGEPSWLRQKVKVPKRLWSAGRSAAAVAYWAQISALAHREDGCRASVARLASYLGTSKRAAERALAELSAPGADGIPELATVRRTGRDGDGETAERRVRAVRRGEHFAYVPVLAAKTLAPRLFVLYCALAYATATRTPVTAAELADVLGVTERSVRRRTAGLEALGWIAVHRRAGAHGRHLYEVYDRPLHPVPGSGGGPDTDGGSGACTDGGSLADKEDAGLTDKISPPPAVLGIRRRRPTATSARDERDGLLDAFGRRRGLDLTPDAWRTVRTVLAPVAHDLDQLTPAEWERLVGAVLAQLHDGQRPERLTSRIERRYARMRPAGTPDDGRPEIRHTGRWLIGAALTRHGCTDPACESGTTWHTGHDCPVCVLRREQAAALARTDAELTARDAQMAAQRPPTPAQRPPDPEPPARPPRPHHAPPHAPQSRVGAPPGGWRALVARERPDAAADAYRHRWRDHDAARLLDLDDTA